MRFPRAAGLAIALAVVSSACSAGRDGGGGEAAPSPSSTSSVDGSTVPSVTQEPTAGTTPGLPPPSVYSSSHPSPAGSLGTTTSAATRGTAGTTTTVAPSTTVPPGLPPEKCPEPKTCRHHTYTSGSNPPRYPAGPDGRVVIEYRLNPVGLDTTYTTVERAEAAFAAAFATWERAAPSLRFEYKGRTNLPATSGDGVNVISFQGAAVITWVTVTNGRPEFDIQFSPGTWRWAPCEQRDGSCTPVGFWELQSIATHEAGHALWMDHVTDQQQDRYMTMWPGDERQIGTDRFWSTLALGDVLGIRALYPCSCPLPPIYDP